MARNCCPAKTGGLSKVFARSAETIRAGAKSAMANTPYTIRTSARSAKRRRQFSAPSSAIQSPGCLHRFEAARIGQEPDRMQQPINIARGVSSPAILITGVWCAILISVAIGPVDFPGQPSIPVLALVAGGVSLFIVGLWAGAWGFRICSQVRPNLPAPAAGTLNIAVAATALLGLAGIALIALDRLVLSGIGNSGYAELLRCAPALIDVVEIRRTPLLYFGYLTFSFGFVAPALFVLRGEEIRGWAAILAQLSLLLPLAMRCSMPAGCRYCSPLFWSSRQFWSASVRVGGRCRPVITCSSRPSPSLCYLAFTPVPCGRADAISARR